MVILLTPRCFVEGQDSNLKQVQQREFGSGHEFLELFKNDINKDGKISSHELSGDRKKLILDYDSDGDGMISKSEARLMAPKNQVDRSRPRVSGRPGRETRRETSRGESRRSPGRTREYTSSSDLSPGRTGGLFFQVFDVNKDGEISRDEIKNASKILMKLDVNGDKRLSRQEIGGDSERRIGQSRSSRTGRAQDNSRTESGRERFVVRVFENDKNTTTGLEGYLRKKEITQLYMCGLAFDYCVFYSALDGKNLGFDVFVFQDLTKSIDLKNSKNIAEKTMRKAGIKLLNFM